MNPPSFCVVLLMEATTSPLVSQVTPEWLARCAAACAIQLSRDVCPVYGGTYAVRVGKDSSDVQPGEIVFSIQDALPAAPGAIAYHDVNGQDVPVAFLALSTCSTLDDVSTAVSHELCETAGDPACDLWADDGAGSEWARELCDAVESNSYPIDLGDGQPPMNVSDFLYPAFFGVAAQPPYSYMQAVPSPQTTLSGVPSAPFTTASGGYQIKRTAGTNETQVQGSVRALRKSKVEHWSSRSYRRGLRSEAATV